MFRFMMTLALVSACAATAMADVTPAPTPTPDGTVLARAKDWFQRIETGNIDRSQLTPAMDAALSDAMVKQVASQVSPLGQPTSFRQTQAGTKDGANYFVYAVTFANGDTWNYLFVYDQATGKVSGLRVAPAP